MHKKILHSSKKGQMLVLAAVSMAALIALAGLAVDMSHLIVSNYKLQRALDASMLNTLVFVEQAISRGVPSKDLVDRATQFARDTTLGNLRMMGIRKDWDRYAWENAIYTGAFSERALIMDPAIDPETGIHILINGKDVITSEIIEIISSRCVEDDDGSGCHRETTTTTETVAINTALSAVSSIKICVTAKLRVTPLLMRLFGFNGMYLKATSCTRRTMAAIAIVLDTSGSMDGTPLVNLKKGAKAFIDQFQESIDMISIITFSTQATVRQPMMRISEASYGGLLGKEALKLIIDGITSGGDTNIPHALFSARKELAIGTKVPGPIGGEPPAFRTIMFFSDGAPTAMTVDFTDPYTSVPWQLSNPVKGPSGTFDDKRWDPSEWGPLLANNSAGFGQIFDYFDSVKHIYTYRPGLYEAGSLLINPASTSAPIPCSSANKVHLLWSSAFIYNDPSDCLRSLSFKDSKGNAHDIDFKLWTPYPYKFPTHINNHGLDSFGRPLMEFVAGYWVYKDSLYYGYEGQPAWWGNNYSSGGPSSGQNIQAMRLPYIEAIIEGDYALAEQVTIYTVGLARVKAPCGPASDPYLPCCGPGSLDANYNEIPCIQPIPCVPNDPRPACNPCDPSTDVNHCQPKDAGKGGGS